MLIFNTVLLTVWSILAISLLLTPKKYVLPNWVVVVIILNVIVSYIGKILELL